MERYCGWLNLVSRTGDVLAESRGKKEDRLLQDAYRQVYTHGIWRRKAAHFQTPLTTRNIKIKPKSDNIPGLQLADLLANPIRQSIREEHGHLSGPLSNFARQILDVADSKFNRRTQTGEVRGWGRVFRP